MRTLSRCVSRWLVAGALCASVGGAAYAIDADVQALQEQNQRLAEQVRAQQRQIDELRARLDRIDEVPEAAATTRDANADRAIRLSAEVGVGFFDSGRNGGQPNAEFRVDDARLFVEAPVWKNVYFFGALEITTREANDEYFHVGELYIDAENVWSAGRDYTLSLRAGRMNLPFGEEYLVRNVIDNPLVSHSLADIWGIDEGIQAYGTLGPLRYNFAVQNGGHRTLRDYDPDKSLVARLGFDATPQLAVSASVMRTGNIAVTGDSLSEVWFANAFFRALGSAASTRTFRVDLAEFDASYRWRTGHVKAAVGWVDFDDDSTAGDHSRTFNYFSLEATQELVGNFFGAARYSTIDVDGGYPLAGQSAAGPFFFSPSAPLTTDLARLSVGVGYRFGPPLVWKLEYSWERGHLLGGARRGDADQLSSLLGIRF